MRKRKVGQQVRRTIKGRSSGRWRREYNQNVG